ncbi:MAG: sensor histidine kinase [Kiritimatiellia bacterium]
MAGGTWLLTVIGLREMEVTRLRTQFVASVSHEFRTPVALLRAAAEALLRRETMDQAKKERYLGIIERESRRLSDLVETVLALTKAREHPEMYRLVPTDVCRLTREVVESMRLRLEQDGFRVAMNVPESEIYVRGDGDALQLVLLNLLDNAIKFSPDRKEVRVEVAPKNAEVMIGVSDKGIGIAEDDRGRIFEPFHRVEHDLVKKTRGTGIGLALVREVVCIHHGSIEVASGPGQGSTFTIILPAWTGKDERRHGLARICQKGR